MGLSEQIEEMEADLESFRSGAKYTELQDQINTLEFKIDDLEGEIEEYMENYEKIRDLIQKF